MSSYGESKKSLPKREGVHRKKKKKEGSKGKTVVKNTKAAEVKFASLGGEMVAKRPYNGKKKKDGVVARGCGAVMSNRRKFTKGSVSAT